MAIVITFFEYFFIISGFFGVGFWALSVFTSLGRSPERFSMTESLTFFDERFLRIMEGVARVVFEEGGIPEILNNGDEFFTALLNDIAKAQKTINIMVFIFRLKDPIAQQVLQALIKKAKQGVKVRLLLDSQGAPAFNSKIRRELKQDGIEVLIFRPLKFGMIMQYHRRNHCRAFIIDGKVGYIGGSAIGQEWTGNAKDSKHWRDVMFRVKGSQARGVQRTFSTLWANMSGEILSDNGLYNSVNSELSLSKWFSLTSSPALQNNLLCDVFWLSCMAAQKSICIQNSYFVPDKHIRTALIKKAGEGLEVFLMFPNQISDERIVHYAGRFYYDRLIRAGINVYEFQPTMMHNKNFVADDYWSIIGSANMDKRSEELNEENVMGILSEDFGKKQRKFFDADLAQCKKITLEDWRKRPIVEKFLERVCVLLEHQL